jgi:hypothetical protein
MSGETHPPATVTMIRNQETHGLPTYYQAVFTEPELSTTAYEYEHSLCLERPASCVRLGRWNSYANGLVWNALSVS